MNSAMRTTNSNLYQRLIILLIVMELKSGEEETDGPQTGLFYT